MALLAGACGGGDDTTPDPEPSAVTSAVTAAPAPGATTVAPTVAARATLVRVADLDQPLAFAPAGTGGTAFIGGKDGEVWVLRDGTVERQAVLDLRDRVSGGSEQGLLGLAVAPEGGHLYVHFTDRDGDTRVVEYQLDGDRPDAASERELLHVRQPFANHNGGQLAFGPDGMLYIGLGDGGAGGDPMGNAQRLDTLLGKILRIDPRASGGRPYSIPPDNPFVDRAGARAEIWAFGLRNPWRFSFDRETGDVWIGDVGQNAIEEIDTAPGALGGVNYGWDRLEGTRRFEGRAPADARAPVFEYPREGDACAVTGGYVYRGRALPALGGAYVFGDYCEGRIRAIRVEGDQAVELPDLGLATDRLASFGEDAAGELWVLSLSRGLFRIAPVP